MQNLNSIEEEMLEYWKSNNILDKTRAINKGKKKFYFLDGPPYVTGDLHLGGMWVKVIKDVYIRYRRFNGFDVKDMAGYDVHGLPIENKVEKELGIKAKNEIETRVGVEKFIEACKKYVDTFMGHTDKDFHRFAISLDFEHPYLPYTNDYIESGWKIFKRISDRGYVYKNNKTTAYCPHCQTSLAQGTMEVEYKEEKDPSIYFTLKVDIPNSSRISKLKLPESLYLLVWTTTPWTIPANVAVAVQPKEQYIIANINGKRFVTAKKRFDALVEVIGESAIIEAEFYGSELEGVRYFGPLEENIPSQKELRAYHKIILSEGLVNMDDGSGLVHIAPGHGLEDYAVGMKNHLPLISPVTADARYSNEAGKYEGIKVPDDANAAIIKDLELDGALIKKGSISHSYPHCWRCDTKVIYMATPQWFFNIQKIKSKLLSENSKVSWHPKEAMNWQSDVLKNAPDWCISRQRYWDIPIPIWECKNCGAFHAVGSLEELKGLSLEPEKASALSDLHRPHIDKIHIKCQKCSGVMDRVPDVFDVWFDSGIAFRASLADEEFEKLFPIDYIVEGKDQLRGWFSALLKISVLAYGKKPYKDIGIDGMLLDSEGREMHKKLGNYVPISEFLKNSSADSFRLWSVQHTPWLDIRLKMNEVKDAERTIVIMHNISNLIGEYEQLLGYKPRVKRRMSVKQLEAEEQWLISRLESIVSEVTSCLESYEAYKGMVALSNFITEDFSRFYLKIAKRKLSTHDKRNAKKVLSVMEYVLYKSNMLLSVAVPFTSEKIYLERYGGMESVFMEKWPRSNAKNINSNLEKSFSVVKEAITAILNSRERANIPLKLPLYEATFELNSDEAFTSLQNLSSIVESYCNIRKINISESAGAEEEIRPAFNRLGPDFKQDAQAVADALKNANPKELDNSIEKFGRYDLHTDKGVFSIRQEHYTKVKKAIESNVTLFKYGKVSINTDISEEMKEEAFIRELIHKLQMMRKEAGLKKADRIKLYYDVMESSDAIVMKNIQLIKKSLNAVSMSKLKNEHDGVNEIVVQGETFKVVLEEIKKSS